MCRMYRVECNCGASCNIVVISMRVCDREKSNALGTCIAERVSCGNRFCGPLRIPNANRQAPVLLHVAGRPKPVMGDDEVEDQTPAPGLISKIVADLYVAALLACAGLHSMLCAHDVSGRAEQRPDHAHHPVVRLGCT